MAHPEFVEAMVKTGQWSEKPDFSKVPSPEVHLLYRVWLTKSKGTERREFEALHPDLDLWLKITGKSKKLETEREKPKTKTKKELEAEGKAEIERSRISIEETKRILSRLKRELEGSK